METATLTAPVGSTAYHNLPSDAQRTGVEPSGDSLYEVVDGRIVVKSPMATDSIYISSELHLCVGGFAKQNKLGRSLSEMLYLLDPKTGQKRRPDVSFVSYSRWPKAGRIPKGDGWNVIPELAIEVVSPSNLANEIKQRIDEYFAATVRLIWVVYPEPGLIEVYTSPTSIQILDRTGILDGGDVLPGFRLALNDLFEEIAAT